MDVRRDENARESWWVKNLTNKTITIGDLTNLPAIKPGKQVDLLRFYTREKVSHSVVLTSLVKSGKLSLNKKKIYTNSFPGNISIADIDEAITPAEENEANAGGGGSFEGEHNDLSGLQGGTSGEYYHLTSSEYSGLGSLFPPPAPSLDDASVTTSGVSGSLSFDDSALPGSTIAEATYIAVTGIGALPAVALDGVFADSGDRVGIVNASTDIVGILNDDVPAHAYSYPANAFGNADQGELILEINGVEVRTIDLSVAGAVDDGTATSGFDISAAIENEFSNGDPFPAFKYRTGTYRIDSGDANVNFGWNYARVIHRIDGSDTTTNYVDWVVDANTVATVYSGETFDSLIMTGSAYLSGVRYYTDGTAEYDVVLENGQRNTYITTDAITFNETNGSIPNQSFSATGGDELQITTLTDLTFTINSGIRLLNQDISVNTNVNRTVQSDAANSATSTISSILMDDLVDHTTTANASENFNGEGYRLPSNISITSTSYASGAGNGPVSWDPTESLVDAGTAGYNDGLLVYNSTLRYPTQGLLGGDFRNTGDGGSIVYAYAGNPDYSTGTTGDRVFLCYFYDASARQNFNFNFTVTSTSFVSVATGPSGNNLTCELLAPNTTVDGSAVVEWKDMVTAYTVDSAIGAYASTYGDTIPTDWGATIGAKSTATSGNAIVIRITASSSWTGSISNITCTFL